MHHLSGIFGIAFMAAAFAAWVTHIVACIINESWILLLFGAAFFPVGVIHGVMVWLGFG